MIDWCEVVTDPLLARCHGVAAVFEGEVYLHGGLSSTRQGGSPLSSLVRWSPANNSLALLDTTGPALSHHTANVVGEVMVELENIDLTNTDSNPLPLVREITPRSMKVDNGYFFPHCLSNGKLLDEMSLRLHRPKVTVDKVSLDQMSPLNQMSP